MLPRDILFIPTCLMQGMICLAYAPPCSLRSMTPRCFEPPREASLPRHVAISHNFKHVIWPPIFQIHFMLLQLLKTASIFFLYGLKYIYATVCYMPLKESVALSYRAVTFAFVDCSVKAWLTTLQGLLLFFFLPPPNVYDWRDSDNK